MKHALTLALMLSTLALGACAGGNRTSETLSEIVRSERGSPYTAAKCEIPGDMVGKPNSELAKMKFKGPIRVIFPGTAVSGDQISNRLNFKVDKKGIIREITCG